MTFRRYPWTMQALCVVLAFGGGLIAYAAHALPGESPEAAQKVLLVMGGIAALCLLAAVGMHGSVRFTEDALEQTGLRRIRVPYREIVTVEASGSERIVAKGLNASVSISQHSPGADAFRREVEARRRAHGSAETDQASLPIRVGPGVGGVLLLGLFLFVGAALFIGAFRSEPTPANLAGFVIGGVVSLALGLVVIPVGVRFERDVIELRYLLRKVRLPASGLHFVQARMVRNTGPDAHGQTPVLFLGFPGREVKLSGNLLAVSPYYLQRVLRAAYFGPKSDEVDLEASSRVR